MLGAKGYNSQRLSGGAKSIQVAIGGEKKGTKSVVTHAIFCLHLTISPPAHSPNNTVSNQSIKRGEEVVPSVADDSRVIYHSSRFGSGLGVSGFV